MWKCELGTRQFRLVKLPTCKTAGTVKFMFGGSQKHVSGVAQLGGYTNLDLN